MKCSKIYNARVQLLFCSLNFLFRDVFVAVAVVLCVRSLISGAGRGESCEEIRDEHHPA